MEHYQFATIGWIRSPFKEKFGVPRQSMMVPGAQAVLELRNDASFEIALKHLEGFSHLWVIFVFHSNGNKPWTPTIRPPRLGGPPRVGVFASRSPHRPNPIGMSAVKIERIEFPNIYLSGVDLLDGTPVLDIKPYLPYTDVIEGATSGWAEGQIPKYSVQFSEQAESFLTDHQQKKGEDLREVLIQVLQWDPRPTSQRKAMPIEAAESQGRVFGFRTHEVEISWQIKEGSIFVQRLGL